MDKQFAKLLALIDYFADPNTAKQDQALSQSRALVAVNLFLVITQSASVPLLVVFWTHAENLLWIVGFSSAILLTHVITPFLLRYGFNLRLLQHFTLISLLIGTIGYSYFSRDGIIDVLPGNQLLILQAALTLFLLGLRSSAGWLAIIVITQFLTQLVYFQYSTANYSFFVFFDNITTFNVTILLLVLIEWSREKITRQRDTERERYRYLATHDALTDLANRSLFEERLNNAIKKSELDDSRVVLLYIDLDDFKPINDRWGHEVGDRVLKIIAARLISTTRSSDTVARLGGDEFAVLMPGLNRNTSVSQLSDAIHKRITQSIHLHGRNLSIGCSIGICSYPENAVNPKQLWQQADAAMYVAKKSEARWHIHSDESQTAT